MSLAVIAIPSAARPPAGPDQVQAAGAPILPSCSAMQDTIARLKSGLPVQDEWISRSEAQLKSADQEFRGAEDQLWDIAAKQATKLAETALKVVRQMEDARELQRGWSSLDRQAWLSRVDAMKAAAKKLENAAKVAKSGTAGLALGTAIAQQRASFADVVKFLDDSKISDEAAKAAAFAVAGVAGQALVESFSVARDVIYASYKGKMSADEAAVHRQNLDAMRAAKHDVETKIYELETDLASPRCTPTPRPADRMSVVKEPDPPPPTGASAGATMAKPGGSSAGKVLGGLVLAGGVGVGTYYVVDKALKEVEDAGSSGGGGGGGGSVSATFVSATTINCNFNAGGIINSCTGTVTFDISGNLATGTTLRFAFSQGPGGNRTTTSNPAGRVSFTISGGTSGSSCPALRNGAIQITATGVVIESFSSLPITTSCQ